jgi:hypothetical protein
MNTEITKAVVPFQGNIRPITGIGNKLAYQDNGVSRYHEKAVSSHYRFSRGNSSYGRLGKRLDDQFILGGNIDIYI